MNALRGPRLLLALASGIALALGLPPYELPLVAWVAPAALVLAVWGGSGWFALLAGLLHGAGFYFVSLPWTYTVMRIHGGLGPLAAGGVQCLLVLYLSLYPAVFAGMVQRIARTRFLRACAAVPFLWVALEWARTQMPELGFPWNLLGYAVARHLGLLQLCAWGGIYALSFVVAAYNALVAAWLATRSRRLGVVALGVTGALLLGVSVAGRYVPAPEGRHVAHLVQVDLPQRHAYAADWMEQQAAELDEMESLSVAAGQTRPGLLIWPEVPAPFSLRDPQFAERAARIARGAQSYFLAGVVEWKPQGPADRAAGAWTPYNSAVLLAPAGQRVFAYDKIHLVPFGEYVPFGRLLGFARQLTAEVGGFRPGRDYAVGALPGGRFAVLICFEAVFPDETRRFVARGAELLVNISNDAWFGRSGAPEQHLAMARVRAVENRRWLLRATNNGHTVAVDPYGRIVARLAPDRRGVLAAAYDFRSDRTPYARWGDVVAWLSLLAAAAFAVPAPGTRAAAAPQRRTSA